MRNQWKIVWLLCLFAATAALPAWHRYGMTRTVTLDAADTPQVWALDDRNVGGASVATLHKAAGNIVLDCRLSAKNQWPYCGFSIPFGKGTHGQDFSRYSDIRIDLRTAGPHPLPIKVYLLNYNPAYSKPNDDGSLKINQVEFMPKDPPTAHVIPLGSFQTSSWWLSENKIPPEQAGPDLSDVTALQLFTGDNAKAGDYTVTVRSISIRGKWLTSIEVLWAILGLWLASALVYLIDMLRATRRRMLAFRLEKQQLERSNASVRSERDELASLATHDALTGLYNRTGLRMHMEHLVAQAQQGARPLSAIFMDLDHFKQINDTHGHFRGDAILNEFAHLLLTHTRQSDFCCRWGGEEFLLLCLDTPLAEACVLAEKLRVLVASHRWFQGTRLRCSFGVAELHAGEDAASFVERADVALYHAKRAGRDRVHPLPAPTAEVATD
ncbi:MAG TPA: GGDEF domain-containing protein [Rhodanobacteraceae bacterium]|nr:GGDEF domain-containing protein [Rhodanobacteraceae bacterium]